MNKLPVLSSHTRSHPAKMLAAALLGLGAAVLATVAAPPQAHAQSVNTRPADRIVAVVNSEPITLSDVQARVARVQAPANGSLPPREELARQVLEQLINERAQMQEAETLGIRSDETTVAAAEANIARQNGLSVDGFRERLRGLGIEPARFQEDLRRDVVLQRLREGRFLARAQVSEREIDDFLLSQRDAAPAGEVQMQLAQILVAVPESADAAALRPLQTRIAEVARRARAGEDFAALAREFSESPEREAGGAMGLRPLSRYPSLFVEAAGNAEVGTVVGPIRSGAGFHVLKVLERRNPQAPGATVPETRARHILLRPSGPEEERSALARLAGYRQQVLAGSATFEALARQHSADGSAAAGGDLGWARPGMFVPEFEEAMNALPPGGISQPLVSRFGVHIIQVLERREVPLSAREQRDVARNVLRQRNAERDYLQWAEEVRGRAYVEYREPPQ
ncbi:MAG: peptidylprolyl isomerase [Serpentinimonas sp.]|nr:peptidylprolyl isomerase [Serpentinimonas sp.]